MKKRAPANRPKTRDAHSGSGEQRSVGARSSCNCLLCQPVEGARPHPIYGYDLDKVKDLPCVVCGQPMANRPYVEELGTARFGMMSFIHQACETPKQASARARMEKNWANRPARKAS